MTLSTVEVLAVDADPSPFALPAIVLVSLATIVIGTFGVRMARSTSDFLVASRTVSPRWNASAISGEYLSAASFLGVAGLVMKDGADMLWYPVGFTAGYLAMLLYVAGPLRRSGAFTLPDFAELRLGSRRLRLLCAMFVVIIGWLYLVPQFQGAGLTLGTVTGAPYWLGAVVVGVVVVLNVVGGGMRSITFVQAFQYWLKLTAIAIPAFVLILAWRTADAPSLTGPTPPTFPERTSVEVEAEVSVLVSETITVSADGVVDGDERAGAVTLDPGRHLLGSGAVLTFPAGAAVPQAVGTTQDTDNAAWALPLGGASADSDHALFSTYSLILATFLGTMGLPHVLVRFYTNIDGSAARRTTLFVLGLLGVFYLFPTLYGALGRIYTPHLLMTGRTDAVVLLLPGAALGGVGGQLLGALVAAGAFAAFLSTSSGLLVSIAGVLSTDLAPGVVRSGGSRRSAGGSIRGFRVGALVAGVMPLVLALQLQALDASHMVGLAFSVAASTFCPLLVLGIWWRKLTTVGATAGLVTGGLLSTGAVLLTAFGVRPDGWTGALLTEPAAWTVPLAFAAMIIGSLLTAGRRPTNINRIMLQLHAPDDLAGRLRSSARGDRSSM